MGTRRGDPGGLSRLQYADRQVRLRNRIAGLLFHHPQGMGLAAAAGVQVETVYPEALRDPAL